MLAGISHHLLRAGLGDWKGGASAPPPERLPRFVSRNPHSPSADGLCGLRDMRDDYEGLEAAGIKLRPLGPDERFRLAAQLLAAVLVCNLSSLGQQALGNPRPLNVDDEGVFLISSAGKPVGSESFKIRSSAGKVEARGEIRLHAEQNGKQVNVQSFPDLVLDSQLRPVTYTWNLKGPQSSRLEVDFRGQPARVRYKTVDGNEDDRDFQLPPDVMVLDDNVIHHYELIVARFLAMGGGKQTLHVFVPQEALPSLLSVEDTGNATNSTGMAAANLRHLLLTTDVTHFDLWVDEQQRLERVFVPAAQLEAIRKR